MNRLKRLVVRLFPHYFLTNFRWYRKHLGGFWCHSAVFGWERRQEWVAKLDIDLCRSNPELYHDGADMDDYR